VSWASAVAYSSARRHWQRKSGCMLAFERAPMLIYCSCFAGALAYGITSGRAAIASWRLLFLVEGLPTIALAPVVLFFLPDSADKARFLTSDEKKVALHRAIRQNGRKERVGSVTLRDTLSALTDLKAWLTALMYFSCNVSYASLPVYLPTIIQEFGYRGGKSMAPVTLAHGTLLTHLSRRTRTLRATILPGILDDSTLHLHRRSNTTAWSDDRVLLHRRRHWLHYASDHIRYRTKIRRCLPRGSRNFPLHRESPPLANEQPGQ
jgi:hypothetical protein